MKIQRSPHSNRARALILSLCYSFVIQLAVPPVRSAVNRPTPPQPGVQTRLKDAPPSALAQVQADKKNAPVTFNSDDLALLEQAALFEQQLEKKGLVYDDLRLNEYLDQVGQKVVPAGPPPEHVRWQFRILRDPFANVLALPNGSVYVTTGLLALLENESQLAGVLAHEVTHVHERHIFTQYRDKQKKELVIKLLNIAATWSSAFGGVGSAISLLADTVQAVLVVTMSGYSGGLEREADTYALRKLSESNYEPKEFVRALRLLGLDYDAELVPLYYGNPVKLRNRVNYLDSLVPVVSTKSISRDARAVNRLRYLTITEIVARHNVQLNLDEERFRTALALSQKLVNFNPASSENIFCLAEAYRSLGPLPIELIGEELTLKGRKRSLKQKQGAPLDEVEGQLIATPEGQAAWKTNQANAEEQYRKALEVDRKNAAAHRGFGYLLEKTQRHQEALEHYREYLKLAPDALDRALIRRRIANLEIIR
jgi:Zn-dependent protease with chaperone function